MDRVFGVGGVGGGLTGQVDRSVCERVGNVGLIGAAFAVCTGQALDDRGGPAKLYQARHIIKLSS